MTEKIIAGCFLFLTFLGIFSILQADQRVYIDIDAIDTFENAFHIHEGNNIWIETKAIHNDETGFYTFESEIKHDDKLKKEFAKSWKCPYCYHMWPNDVFPCQNLDCPSRKNCRD